MEQKIFMLIKEKTLDIRKFIDEAEPLNVLSLSDSTPDELAEAYRDVVNYNNKLAYYGKTVKFLISELVEKRDMIDKATPNGSSGVKQIQNILNYLYALDKALDEISSGVFYSIKYYEKLV